MIGKELPLESVTTVTVQVDHTGELLELDRKPKRATEVVAPFVGELKVLPHHLLALYGKQGLTQALLAVRGSRGSKDVFPELFVLILKFAYKVH